MTDDRTLVDHVHGVINNRCRHPDCKAAFSRYRKRWQLDQSRGILRTTDSQASRLHVATLTGQGWSLRGIAAAAKTSPSVISLLSTGKSKRLRVETAAAILAIDPTTLPLTGHKDTEDVFVSKVGAVRRIRALLAIGWPHHLQREHCGVNTDSLCSQQGRWITRTTHDAIAAMYRDLSTRPGPSPQTRGWAAKFGYPGPMHWDDIDTDPAPESDMPGDEEVPALDEAAVLRRMDGDRTVRLTRLEAVELVRRWSAAGRPLNECERLTGLKPDRYKPDTGERGAA